MTRRELKAKDRNAKGEERLSKGDGGVRKGSVGTAQMLFHLCCTETPFPKSNERQWLEQNLKPKIELKSKDDDRLPAEDGGIRKGVLHVTSRYNGKVSIKIYGCVYYDVIHTRLKGS